MGASVNGSDIQSCCHQLPFPNSNIASENEWLEDEISFGAPGLFLVNLL